MKGIVLVEKFFNEKIKPLLISKYPDLKYAAASIGAGSDIIGYDDEISQDHDWGLKLYIFLDDDKLCYELDLFFRKELPIEFLGYNTYLGEHAYGTQRMAEGRAGDINHGITITTIQKYLKRTLNLEINDINELSQLSLTKWLAFPEQKLLEFVSGKVYWDNLGNITKARDLLRYYPEVIWFFAILGEWNQIAEEQVFISRTGDRDDDIGSRIIATSLVNRIIRLGLHLEKRYIPYSKWIGTAFKEIELYDELSPLLTSILESDIWKEREKLINQALSLLIEKHFEIGLIKRYDYGPSQFHTRDYFVIKHESLMSELTDKLPEKLKSTVQKIGTINQIISYPNIKSYLEFQTAALAFYNSLLKE